MIAVPPLALAHWDRAFAGRVVAEGLGFTLVRSAKLSTRRPAMILERDDGLVRAAVSPGVAARIGRGGELPNSAEALRQRLTVAEVALHDPDHLFYLPNGVLPEKDLACPPRRLTPADHIAFAAFAASASAQDREAAFVELDHWAVFGYFDRDRLVSAASLCLWAEGTIADLGVLTLPHVRGRGLARATVGAICRHARAAGREPQYRCQLDNHASIALARSCALAHLGTWTVAREPD
jgi:RimJ/RimL family protein N-acetyltransferase